MILPIRGIGAKLQLRGQNSFEKLNFANLGKHSNQGQCFSLVLCLLSFAPLTLLLPGGGGTQSNFAPFKDPLTVKYIEMFHADFSYLSIY